MKLNFKVILGVVLIVLIAYAAVTAVLPVTATGSTVTVASSTGFVSVTNPTDAPVQANLTAQTAFTVAVSDSDETLTSTREGTGRAARHFWEGELPAGNLELRITRGSDITFTLAGEGDLSVTAAPRNDNDRNLILGLGVAAIAVILFWMSSSTGHAWLRNLRSARSTSPANEAASA